MEHFDAFSNGLKQMGTVADDMIEQLYDLTTYKMVKGGEQFVRAGEQPVKMAYVLNGVFRLYYIDSEGHDFTKGFSVTGRFVTSYSAMLEKRQSYFSIEAVRDSEVLDFRYQDWISLAEKDPRWYSFMLGLVEAVYIMKERREKTFLLDDAKTRYDNFLADYPNLMPELKLYHVASFLGITPETLSRLRKKYKN